MKTKTIFELPIYEMSEDDFDKMWEEKVVSQIEHYEQFKDAGVFYPERVWKYNRIVGYVEISASFDTVWFTRA